MDANMQVLPAEWDVAGKKWVSTQAVDGSKQCVGCHVTGYDASAKTRAQAVVGCEMCHGPGSAHASTADKTKITNPGSLPKDRQAMICGQCHSKGTDPTKTHAFPTKFRPGDDLSKVFIDAKPTTHGRNQQYSEMLGGKHFAAGVICTTCHEPHGAGTTEKFQLRKPTTELCMGCHKDKDMKSHAPGAPEGATCDTCHMVAGSHTFKVGQ
jgi:predicted CXXCH cytochrome family protein